MTILCKFQVYNIATKEESVYVSILISQPSHPSLPPLHPHICSLSLHSQILRVILHLYLSQNIGYIPCSVQYIPVAYLFHITSSLYLLNPPSLSCLFHFPLLTGNHYTFLFLGKKKSLSYSQNKYLNLICSALI